MPFTENILENRRSNCQWIPKALERTLERVSVWCTIGGDKTGLID